MGLAISDPGNTNADELLRKADLAMYQAKQEGKGRCVVFHADLDGTSRERLEMEAELRRGIGRNEFSLRFQPIFDLYTHQVQAVEALVFWQHPRLGEVAPAVIVPLAEESGSMVELGQWIVREACRQARAWSPRGVRDDGVPVCVNLSPGQFHHPSLAVDTAAALDWEDLSPAQLVLEIAESTLAHEPAGALDRLAALRNIGVRLAIDDFGTGHLDLHVLKHLPVETIKIEHTFIRGVETDERKQAIVRGVLALAGDCGLRVVGEGIETQVQLDQLLRMGCVYGQGYLLARPMSAEDCAALLARQH
jgi:EAL domain-containing protein (putative c-di-GMP-specific phosphodiesterase class I)